VTIGDGQAIGLGEKQQRFYRFAHSEDFSALAVGGKRSAKSHVACLTFADLCAAEPDPRLHIITGASRIVLVEELLPHIMGRLRQLGGRPHFNKGDSMLRCHPHRFFVMPWTNLISHKRFEGFTVHHAFIDEADKVPLSFYRAVLGRLSYEDSKIVLTANPAGPRHWLREEILEGRLDLVLKFLLDDNPSFSEATKARYRRMYPKGTVEYDRFILGRWSATEGLVFPEWPEKLRRPMRVVRCFGGLDYGESSDTCLVRVSHLSDGSYHVEQSFVIPGSKKVSVPASIQAKRIVEWVRLHPIDVLFVDPSAAIRAELRNLDPPFVLRNANNDRPLGRAFLQRLFGTGDLVIDASDETEYLKSQLGEHIWSPTKQDEPLKENDHGIDALRYAMYSYGNRAFRIR